MPRLQRVLEIAVYCDDLARSIDFYARVLGGRLLDRSDRFAAFDVGGSTVLLVFVRGQSAAGVELPAGRIPPHDGAGPLHFAFAVSADELAGWEQHLADAGVNVESRVTWPRGGTSLYFRDPDGHLVELATPGLWATY
ncbi:MAG: VOC family protein [Gemmatimonadota bacterium]